MFIYQELQEEYALEYIDKHLPELCRQSTVNEEARRKFRTEPRRHNKGYDQSQYAKEVAEMIVLPSLAEVASFASPPQRTRPPHMITLHNPHGGRHDNLYADQQDQGSRGGRHGGRSRGRDGGRRGGNERRPTNSTKPQQEVPPTYAQAAQNQHNQLVSPHQTEEETNTEEPTLNDGSSYVSIPTIRTDHKSLETMSAMSTQMTAIENEQKRMAESMHAIQQDCTADLDRFFQHAHITQELSVEALTESRRTNNQLQQLLTILMHTNAIVLMTPAPHTADATIPAQDDNAYGHKPAPTTPQHRNSGSENTSQGLPESSKRPAAASPKAQHIRAPNKRPTLRNQQTPPPTLMETDRIRSPDDNDSDTNSWTGRFSPIRGEDG